MSVLDERSALHSVIELSSKSATKVTSGTGQREKRDISRRNNFSSLRLVASVTTCALAPAAVVVIFKLAKSREGVGTPTANRRRANSRSVARDDGRIRSKIGKHARKDICASVQSERVASVCERQARHATATTSRLLVQSDFFPLPVVPLSRLHSAEIYIASAIRPRFSAP